MGRCAEGTLILSHDPGAAQRLRPASPNDESVIHPHTGQKGQEQVETRGKKKGTSFTCVAPSKPLEVNEEYQEMPQEPVDSGRQQCPLMTGLHRADLNTCSGFALQLPSHR